MLSPADLIDLAENFARRIPTGDAYLEERNTSWLAVGHGWLTLGDAGGAERVLARLDHPRCQAKLRHSISLWVGQHPRSEPGQEILRNTIKNIAMWEPLLNRREISELAQAGYGIVGLESMIEFAQRLEDPFTAAWAFTEVAKALPQASRRPILEAAERRAIAVQGGNRDYALRTVMLGFRAAGLDDDARRVWSTMEDKLEDTDQVLNSADALLKEWAAIRPQPPSYTDLMRLERFLEYRCNDLKVQLLADLAARGSIDDPDLESALGAEPFLRIERPRAASLHGDPSTRDAESFARFLFDRPVSLHESDERLLEGSDCFEADVDAQALVERVTELFENFGEVARRFSPEQIDQGLWYLFGARFTFPDLLRSAEVPLADQERCVRAMLAPFRDYYAQVGEEYQVTAFYMWWDSLFHGGGEPATEQVSIEILQQILALSEKHCQVAALHGLNHLHRHPRSKTIVERYIDEHRYQMTADEISWAEACRDGNAI
jgi:hypothetical protein